MNKAVFLDRDGVINRTFVRQGRPYAPRQAAQFEILPGVPEAIQTFKRAGYFVVVVTNQPDVATGAVSQAVIEEMHDHLRDETSVDAIKVCYHTDKHQCDCRKPKPGMLLETAHEQSLCLSDSWMIGDRWSDVEAGRRAGCKTVWIRSNYQEQQAANPDLVADSLLEASHLLCPLSVE